MLVLLVLCSIGLVSSLGYRELSNTTKRDAENRIDRAARAAVAILCYGTDSTFEPAFDSDGNPVSLEITKAAGNYHLGPSEKIDRLINAIGRTNQGAVNFFEWSAETASLDRFATTFSKPDGSPAPAFSIREGHPAYANLAAGRPFTGNVPVQGRFRLAYLIPVFNPNDTLAGAFAVDVGWADDLTLAQNRLKTRIATATIIILSGTILIGGLLLRHEMRPLRKLAAAADALAAGKQPKQIPFGQRQDEIGDLAHGLAKVTDLQDKLHKLAYIDPITTAGNRARYFADLNKTLTRTKTGDHCASLIHLDFNRFSKVNDTFGHQVGNRVLIQAYARLSNIFGPHAHISRISADDFCVLLPHDDKGAIAENYAIQAIEMLSAPFQVEEGEIHVDPRIGIALLPQDAADAETAHRMAGLALRAAKSGDSPHYRYFSPPLNDRVQTEMLTETLLRAALKTRQLCLHYQPQICPADGSLLGMEALIRWPNDKRGFIPPDSFIPIAEKTGLILELGQFVLDEACKQAAKWLQAGLDFQQVSVNVSPLQFRQSHFAASVKQTLETYGLPAEMLCLEVTETVFLDTSEKKVLDILSQLQDIGVELSLDDFGSGYSSLNYLHSLPFRELKIDRVFLTGADQNRQKAQLFQAIVGLAHSLGLRVIAEGAETAGEFALSAAHSCDGVQGFYCSTAVPGDEVWARIEAFQKTVFVKGSQVDRRKTRIRQG